MKKQIAPVIKPKIINFGSSSLCIDLNHKIKRYYINRGKRRMRADCVCESCGYSWREEYILMYSVEKNQ